MNKNFGITFIIQKRNVSMHLMQIFCFFFQKLRSQSIKHFLTILFMKNFQDSTYQALSLEQQDLYLVCTHRTII